MKRFFMFIIFIILLSFGFDTNAKIINRNMYTTKISTNKSYRKCYALSEKILLESLDSCLSEPQATRAECGVLSFVNMNNFYYRCVIETVRGKF